MRAVYDRVDLLRYAVPELRLGPEVVPDLQHLVVGPHGLA